MYENVHQCTKTNTKINYWLVALSKIEKKRRSTDLSVNLHGEYDFMRKPSNYPKFDLCQIRSMKI